MKITQILYSGLGGQAAVAFGLAKYFKQLGWDNSFIFYGIEDLAEDYRRKCEQNSYPYHFRMKKSKIDFAAFSFFYRSLNAQKSNFIILHSLNCMPFMISKPSLIQFSIGVEHTPNSAKARMDWIYSQLCFFILPKIVVLTKQYQKELLMKSFNINKTVIIPNGIDTIKHSKNKTKSNNAIINISMIGRFSVQKRQDLLINAFGKLQHLKEFNLLLAGTGSELENCKKAAEKLKLTHKVFFKGMLNEDEIILLLNKTDLYVHASAFETFSTSILQAMSCGLPVICTPFEGVESMCTHAEDAWIVEDFSSQTLSNAIAFLMERPELRKKLGDNARKKVENFYSLERMGKRYVSLINSYC